MAEIRPRFSYEVVFSQAEYTVLLKLLAGTPLTPEEHITQETLGEALRARALELHQDRARRLNAPSEGAPEVTQRRLPAPRPGEVER